MLNSVICKLSEHNSTQDLWDLMYAYYPTWSSTFYTIPSKKVLNQNDQSMSLSAVTWLCRTYNQMTHLCNTHVIMVWSNRISVLPPLLLLCLILRYMLTMCLTYWGRDKMVAIFQTTFSNAFFLMEMYEFRLRFHWNLFLMVQLTIFQHWFR